jgi:membrane-associated protease RseP (regulator of RpoE activity)
MPEWSLWILGALIFIVALCISVVLHEAGHAVVAKLFKLNLREFFIGFGPKIFKFKRGETEYGLRWIPLGGFVRIEDWKHPEKSYERLALTRVHPLKRVAIFAAGPIVNLILGSALVLAAIMMIPYDKPTTTIASVAACQAVAAPEATEAPCGAKEAGITPGSTVLEVDGIAITEAEELRDNLKNKDKINLLVKNAAGEEKTYDVTLTNGKLGVQLMIGLDHRTIPEASTFLVDILKGSIASIQTIPETAPSVVTSIATGERDERSVGSMVSAGKAYGDATVAKDDLEEKVINYLLLTGMFNLGLGIVNILPLLPLDGGRIAIAFVDWGRMWWAKFRKIEYTPVKQKWYVGLSIASGVVVLGFMAILILSDFSLLFRGNL